MFKLGILAIFITPLVAQTPAPLATRAPIPNPTAAPSANTQGSARLEGRVISLAGDPLRKATVRLQMLAGPRPAQTTAGTPMQVIMSNYSSTTDNDGGFVFEDVEPSRYALSAERNGFVRAVYGAKGQDSQSSQLNLTAGQRMTGVVLKMTPQAMIGGKITDEDGDPLANAQVQLFRLAWSQGRRQLQQINNAGTLPDGTFLMANLVAGKYYLGATNMQAMRMNGRERPGRKGQQEEYVTTYYPSALDWAQAAPIEVTAGIDVRGIEIRMRKTRVFRVSGRALHSSGALTQGVQLMLIPLAGENSFSFGRAQAVVRDQNGIFEFNNILPGAYVLQTMGGPGGPRGPGGAPAVPMLGRMHVSVGGEDVNNVTINLGPGADLTGQFLLEDVGPLNADARAKFSANSPASPANTSPGNRATPQNNGMRLPVVQLFVAEGMNLGQTNNQSKDDGSFVMKNVQPDRYRVSAGGLPEGCYAKQIRFGGQDITRAVLDLTSGAGGQIDILVSPKAAQVAGVVRNAKGEPAKDTALTLWQSADSQTGAQEFVRNFRTDENGSFKFTSLAPGEYRIAAWEQIDTGVLSNPDFRAAFESSAITLKLQENARENVEVKVIPFDAVEAEAAKIR